MTPPFSARGSVLAVLDTVDAGRRAVSAVTETGVPQAMATLLEGESDAERAFGRGGREGRGTLWTRVRRAVAFTQGDQWVDFAMYEAALRDGRAVVAVRAPRDEDRARVVAALKRAGAHFINYYGGLITEDISPWRGKSPDVPWLYHR